MINQLLAAMAAVISAALFLLLKMLGHYGFAPKYLEVLAQAQGSKNKQTLEHKAQQSLWF